MVVVVCYGCRTERNKGIEDGDGLRWLWVWWRGGWPEVVAFRQWWRPAGGVSS